MTDTQFVIADTFGSSPFDLRLGPYGDGHLFAGDGLGLGLGGFVADPFWYTATRPADRLLFEAFTPERGRGSIGAADRDGDRWVDARVVLDEPFHLSYPHPVREPGYEGLVLVEGAASGGVRAYRWDGSGPFRFEAEILPVPLIDPTPLSVDGTWFLFGATDNRRHDRLELWVSSGDLFGPWAPHPASPVVEDPNLARPGGPVFEWDGQRYRTAQVCGAVYGQALVAVPLLELTPDTYREGTAVPLLGRTAGSGIPSIYWWNRLGMHHLDFTADLGSGFPDGGVWAVIDGQRPPER